AMMSPIGPSPINQAAANFAAPRRAFNPIIAQVAAILAPEATALAAILAPLATTLAVVVAIRAASVPAEEVSRRNAEVGVVICFPRTASVAPIPRTVPDRAPSRDIRPPPTAENAST